MWYNGGMTTDNWLAISAGATFLLALAAFWAIWQNHSLRKRERKERLLNEIIEWATQILECSRAPTFIEPRLKLTEEGVSTFEFELDITSRAAFNVLSWRAVHIGFIAQYSIGNKGLKDAVEDTRTLIRRQVKLLSLASDKKLKNRAAVGKHRNKVDDKAKKVIELAVRLL
jgi:hypothetical protein